MNTANNTQFMVRLPEVMLGRLDQLIAARREDMQPATRSSLVREIVTSYLRQHAPASAPVRTRSRVASNG